jgi:AcrR family transcriptional regulator
MAGRTQKHEEQIRSSRSWITESLFRLLTKKTYKEISVADITEKAGVARQTFYRHFKNKDDIIIQFLERCLKPNPIKIISSHHEKCETLVFTMPWKKFVRYTEALKAIVTSDAEDLLFKYARKYIDRCINLYDDSLSGDEKFDLRYMVQFTSMGISQVICDWIKNDMPISVEKLNTWLTHINIYYEKFNDTKIIIKYNDESKTADAETVSL